MSMVKLKYVAKPGSLDKQEGSRDDQLQLKQIS